MHHPTIQVRIRKLVRTKWVEQFVRLFLTGATGFVGSHLTTEALRRGHSVVALVRPGSNMSRLRDSKGDLSIIYGDLDEPENLREALAQTRADVVCHAAWAGVFNADHKAASQRRNIERTALLASAAAEAGTRIFVGLGSQAEYGPINRRAQEDDREAPTTEYGLAKCAARAAAQSVCEDKGLRFVWLRIFSLYGPGDREGWLLPTLIRELSQGRSPPLTEGRQAWDFLFISDAARAVMDVAECHKAEGVFNLGSGEAPPLREIVERLRDLLAADVELRFGDIPYRPEQVMHLQADIRRLRAAVDWRPQIDLMQGLRETITWYTDGQR
jgi:nucleoside-diphosphate-sugar epimerase